MIEILEPQKQCYSRVKRPWGCKKFGFISKNLPYQEVFSTTGIECAYRKDKFKEKSFKN